MSLANSRIHPSAIIDVGAQVGEGTYIWHFCHLMPKSKVGRNCILGQNVFIDNEVVLGNGVKVQNNVSLYTGVICDDDVFLGPSCVFTNVINPRSAIVRKHEYMQTHVGKGATIGANATIVCGHDIGAYAFIGAGAVVAGGIISLVRSLPTILHGIRAGLADFSRAAVAHTAQPQLRRRHRDLLERCGGAVVGAERPVHQRHVKAEEADHRPRAHQEKEHAAGEAQAADHRHDRDKAFGR